MFSKSDSLHLKNLKIVKLYESLLMNIQHMVLYLTFGLILLLLAIVFLKKLQVNETKAKTIFNWMETLMSIFLFFVTYLTLFKFALELWIYITYNFYITEYMTSPINLSFYFFNKVIFLNSSNFSDMIILLAISSMSMCLYRSDNKKMNKQFTNLNLFSMIIMLVMCMVYTYNLFMMFLSFEILFLSTAYYICDHDYLKKTNKTLEFFFYGTLSGTFLILLSLSYMYVQYKTFNFLILMSLEFSTTEKFFLSFFMFLSFSLSMPVFPLYQWLLNVHSKASINFLMFLNGFLLKTVTYCLYCFNLMLKCEMLTIIFSMFLLFSIIEAAFKFWSQTKFMNLMTFAIIQEMNTVFFLMLNLQNNTNYCLVLFMLVHSWTVALMFCLVEAIEKKTQSDKMEQLFGVVEYFKELKIFMWMVALSFSVFPYSLKFCLEMQAFSLMVSSDEKTFFFTAVCWFLMTTGGFFYHMIFMCYGDSKFNKKTNYILSNKDKYLFYGMSFVMVALNIFNFLMVFFLP